MSLAETIRPSGPVMARLEWDALMTAMFRYDPLVQTLASADGRTTVVVAEDCAIVEHEGRPGDTMETVCAAIDALLGAGAARAVVHPARVVVDQSDRALADPAGELRLVAERDLVMRVVLRNGIELPPRTDFFD